MTCPACGAELAPGATFCPACRERGGPPVAAPAPLPPLGRKVPRPEPANDPRERLFLVLACVVSAGALAIPRLRRSRAFGPLGKWILGTFALLQTTLSVGIIVYVCLNAKSLMTSYLDWLSRKTTVVYQRATRNPR